MDHVVHVAELTCFTFSNISPDAHHQGSDEDYDFDYESGDEDEQDNQISENDPENNYYFAKGLKEDDLEGALAKFRTIVDAEEEPGKW